MMSILLWLALVLSGTVFGAGVYYFWKNGVMDTNVASFFGKMFIMGIVFIFSLVALIYI
ncbi:MAG: hypothetical protein V4690_01065 [Patescibacteria group bacterium]